MTRYEFSNEFDIMFNNIMSDSAPGLTEYEKSVFLTRAQDSVIDALYNGSFERSEELRRSLDVITVEQIEDYKEIKRIKPDHFHHTLFNLRDNARYIVFEAAQYDDPDACNDGEWVQVIPERLDDLHRDLKNPFRGPSLNRVLRLDSPQIELVSKYRIGKYLYKYIREPYPIILEPLEDGLSIGGLTKPLFYNVHEGEEIPTDGEVCELNDIVHDKILFQAVALAKQAYASA